MSDLPKDIERLISKAKREVPPQLDVTQRVLDSLQSHVDARSDDRALWIAAVVSIAAAVLVMLCAGYQGALTSDPMVEMICLDLPTMQ